MYTEIFDAIIVGAGAAGLAAGAVCAKNGCRTLIIDRDERTGGILNQCIHNGFGIQRFKEELTGPEFAWKYSRIARDSGADVRLNTMVKSITPCDGGNWQITALSRSRGVEYIRTRAVMLASGCRERTRGAVAIPGKRPAGIFTAGSAQKLLNRFGKLPGRCAVIVGSGDIGLIMARRLTWCGIEVKAVIEIMPFTAGLTRNVVQCLDDFNIPLHLSTQVVNIHGDERVTGITAAHTGNDGKIDMDTAFDIECDTLLFSVGLIPEMELARPLNITMDDATRSAIVDSEYMTSQPGIFAAGNALHVHDLADFAAAEAEDAAQCMCSYIRNGITVRSYKVHAGSNLKYAVPGKLDPKKTNKVYFRSTIVAGKALLRAFCRGECFWQKQYSFVRPAEMICAEIPAGCFDGEISFTLEDPAQ